MPDLIANAVQAADQQLSGKFVIALITAILTGVGVIMGKIWGHKTAAQRAVTIDGQPIQFQQAPTIVTLGDHQALEGRVDRLEIAVDDIRVSAQKQFVSLIESGGAREQRLTDRIDSVADRLTDRLDAQFGPKPRRARSSS